MRSTGFFVKKKLLIMELYRIFSLPTAALRKGPPAEGEVLPITMLGRKSSQGLGIALNALDDTLYFSPLQETSVAAWNPVNNQQKYVESTTKLHTILFLRVSCSRLIAYDPKRLQFPAEIRWVDEESDSIFLLSTRFQKFFRRSVTPTEVNLRIIRIPLNPRLSHPSFGNNIFFK